MNIEMVAPSQLHRNLERAKNSDEERKSILLSTLNSRNFAVIRRIPELLSPLSDEEKTMIIQWAEELTQDQDVSNRDFAFHLAVNCGVSAESILSILEKHRTFSRSALEHIQQIVQSGGLVSKLDIYLREVAEALLIGESISPRDRGRHMLMTLARSGDDWQTLSKRFSEMEITDLRQKVIERFLQECSDETALMIFIDNVVKMCFDYIHKATKEDVHKEASHMHWVLMCLIRAERKQELSQAASLFESKFGSALPRSVQSKILNLFPRVLPQTRIEKDPSSIEAALSTGWVIRDESGKQVILTKDGRSITRYRSK